MYSRYGSDWEPRRQEPHQHTERDPAPSATTHGAPSRHASHHAPPSGDRTQKGGGMLSSLMSRFNGMDKGDLLLIAVLVFLLFEGEDKEIVILLGIVIFLGWM